MPQTTTHEFLKELDLINDRKSPGSNTEHTVDLLEEGDKLFNASEKLQEMIRNNSLRQTISGDSYIVETVDGIEVQRPVIDLVQQGGTMLGIGLLGYTYIMERAGVRFRSMAGTSAGAINTLLISALPECIYKEKSPFFNDGRQASKSEFLAYLVANKEFIKFIDRGGVIGSILRGLIKRITFLEKIAPFLMALIPILLITGTYYIYKGITGLVFSPANKLNPGEDRLYHFITAGLTLTAVFLLCLLLLFRLLKNHKGVNPGETIYNWMKQILETKFVNVHTTADLTNRKKQEAPVHNDKFPEPFADPRLVFISANLTHNRIVKFPDNSGDYWNPLYADQVTPAAFVRASMSLPFIYYAFIPDVRFIHNYVPLPQPAPSTTTATEEVDTSPIRLLARFVDGGMLSNFPIREFHVPPPIEPRYPTFGVLLGTFYTQPETQPPVIIQQFNTVSVFKYIMSFISTFRNFYDRDFLVTHLEFKLLVSAVDTKKFNSLDFGMTTEVKKKLFAAGAQTAIDQLTKFKWDEYLEVRRKNIK